MTCTNGPFSFVHHSCNPCRTNDGKRLKENHSCKWMHVWCFSIRALSVQACRARAVQPDASRPTPSPAGESPSSLAGPFLPSAGPSFPRDDAMTRDTLSTLDLSERPGQRVIWIRRVPHYQVDGPVELRPGERPFAAGPHHDAHYTREGSQVRSLHRPPSSPGKQRWFPDLRKQP
jgi:hypothetical protein